MKVLKCPSCKKAGITLYMGGQFGKYQCKCGYIGSLVIEEDIPIEKPKKKLKK